MVTLVSTSPDWLFKEPYWPETSHRNKLDQRCVKGLKPSHCEVTSRDQVFILKEQFFPLRVVHAKTMEISVYCLWIQVVGFHESQ
jgi:hypothetical protein